MPQLHVTPAGSCDAATSKSQEQDGRGRHHASLESQCGGKVTSQHSRENVAEEHSQGMLLFAQRCSSDKGPSPGDNGVLLPGPYLRGRGQDQAAQLKHVNIALCCGPRQVCSWRGEAGMT